MSQSFRRIIMQATTPTIIRIRLSLWIRTVRLTRIGETISVAARIIGRKMGWLSIPISLITWTFMWILNIKKTRTLCFKLILKLSTATKSTPTATWAANTLTITSWTSPCPSTNSQSTPATAARPASASAAGQTRTAKASVALSEANSITVTTCSRMRVEETVILSWTRIPRSIRTQWTIMMRCRTIRWSPKK